MFELSEAARYVLEFINRTSSPVFLTGKAGTGKTTLLREIMRTTYKNAVVVAPTGIAALNAGGVTIHSMFGLPLAAFIPDSGELPTSPNARFENRETLRRHFRLSAPKRAVVRAMELLVIDEVSMLRPDLLDALDMMLQHVRRIRLPFGGVQVLFIGDLLQLPPVIKNEEWLQLSKYYTGKYFFNSRALTHSPPVYIELSKIFRQDDQRFIDILNELRHNTLSHESVSILNSFVNPGYDPSLDDGRIILTTHNVKADSINERSLAMLPEPSYAFKAEIFGDFPERMYPIEPVLHLKAGTRVMFIKNDLSPEKRFFNGKTGIVSSVDNEDILVEFEDGETIEVPRYEWQNIQYTVDPATREVTEEILGTFVHYPLRLAWAITVHKSQGLTFERAALDVSQVFMPGQAYVALSRLRTLDGLVLLSPMRLQGINSDRSVTDFASRAADQKLPERLQSEVSRFLQGQLSAGFDLTGIVEVWDHVFSKSGATNARVQKYLMPQRALLDELIATARNFMSRLPAMFDGADREAIEERTIAASRYFVPRLTQILSAVKHEREELESGKKAKGVTGKLDELEEGITSAILSILKSERLASIFRRDEAPSRENLGAGAVSRLFRERVGEIVPKRAAKEAKKKKNTYLQTLELWQDGQSVADIAAVRKLSERTIFGHMAQLVQIKAVNVSELLPQHTLEELHTLFANGEVGTLSQMKEIAGDRFTYEDLKIFRASLANVPQAQPE